MTPHPRAPHSASASTWACHLHVTTAARPLFRAQAGRSFRACGGHKHPGHLAPQARQVPGL